MGGLCGVSQKQAESEVVQRRTARPHSYNNTDVNRKDDKKSEKFNDMEEYTGMIYFKLFYKMVKSSEKA